MAFRFQMKRYATFIHVHVKPYITSNGVRFLALGYITRYRYR
jgi:hypothetical protein